MDIEEEAEWVIEDLEGNRLTVRGSLFEAYYKARALDCGIFDYRESAQSGMDLRTAEGTVINTIRKA